MRRAIGIGVVAALLVVLAGVGIAVAAYHAGESHAVVETVARAGDAAPGEVHVYGRGWGPGFGFFPFGFFLFPLLLIGTFLLVRLAFWRGRWGGPGLWGRGPGGPWAQQQGQWGYGPWGYGPWGPGQPPAQQGGPEQGAKATGTAQASALDEGTPGGAEPAWHPEDQAGGPDQAWHPEGQAGRTSKREDDPEAS